MGDDPEKSPKWPTKFDASVVDQILEAQNFLVQDEREQRRFIQNEGFRLKNLGEQTAVRMQPTELQLKVSAT
jgi:hypothetical protein